MYIFECINANDISKFFPGKIPCTCYKDKEKIYKVPRYDVEVILSDDSAKPKIVSEIVVTCDCCHKKGKYFVEPLNVPLRFLAW